MIASTLFPPRLRGPILLFSVATLAVIESPAQSQKGSSPSQVVASQRATAAHETAKILAARSDYTKAAQVLDALSSAPIGSAARGFETAQRLTLLASALSRSGDAVGAQAVASGALQFLAAANRQPSNPDLKAAIQSQAGFLHEHYLGDWRSAEAAYRAAADLTPANAAAREKLQRFEETESNVHARALQNR